jgi:hypothetical protein
VETAGRYRAFAVLLPLLVSLPQPLALLEVGASAGLCLYPDVYAYRYGDASVGAGDVVLGCALSGGPAPDAGPRWCGGPDRRGAGRRHADDLPQRPRGQALRWL